MATSVKLSLCLAPNDRLSAAATVAAAGVLGARIAVAGVLGAEIAVAEPRGDLALACIFEYYQEGCACVESSRKRQKQTPNRTGKVACAHKGWSMGGECAECVGGCEAYLAYTLIQWVV